MNVSGLMAAKKIAPAAIVALKESLTNLYCYKSDLRSFLTSALTNSALLSLLDWGDFKRNIVNVLENRNCKRGKRKTPPINPQDQRDGAEMQNRQGSRQGRDRWTTRRPC
jgi:hypothetical protein